MKENYLNYINWLRGVAIFFVVITHVDYAPLASIPGSDYIIRFFANGTFMFVFISGFLFWHLIGNYEYSRYLKAKFKNVIIPYTLYIILALLMFSFAKNKPISALTVIKEYLVGGGMVGELWFIPMIVIIFLISPLLIKIIDSKFFYPALILFLFFSLTSFRPNSHTYPLYMVFHFLGVFLLGVYFKIHQDFFQKHSIKFLLFSIPAFLISLSFTVEQHRVGMPYFWPLLDGELAFNFAQIQMVFLVVIFMSLLSILESSGMSENKTLDLLAKYSFGIYFIHGFFILIKRGLVNLNVINNIYAGPATYLIDTIVILMLSIVICHVAYMAFGKRARYITGVAYK